MLPGVSGQAVILTHTVVLSGQLSAPQRHTRTHRLPRPHRLAHKHVLTDTLAFFLIHAHRHTHTQSPSHTLSFTFIHILIILSHTLPLSHSHAHTRSADPAGLGRSGEAGIWPRSLHKRREPSAGAGALCTAPGSEARGRDAALSSCQLCELGQVIPPTEPRFSHVIGTHFAELFRMFGEVRECPAVEVLGSQW